MKCLVTLGFRLIGTPPQKDRFTSNDEPVFSTLNPFYRRQKKRRALPSSKGYRPRRLLGLLLLLLPLLLIWFSAPSHAGWKPVCETSCADTDFAALGARFLGRKVFLRGDKSLIDRDRAWIVQKV